MKVLENNGGGNCRNTVLLNCKTTKSKVCGRCVRCCGTRNCPIYKGSEVLVHKGTIKQINKVYNINSKNNYRNIVPLFLCSIVFI